MADVSLFFGGLPAILLKPDTIYRIGRQKGLEISIADESMELAHATACILRRGVVRLAALVGKIFVNDQEETVVDIGMEDASAGKVKLRFGNVEARLEFGEDHDEVHDSSGFGECLKNGLNNTTLDSMDVPETQPPSANTSVNTTSDSLFIPETQAVVCERPSTGERVSMGEDFMIPETQDMLADLPPEPPVFKAPLIPVVDNPDPTMDTDGESSQGSIIRMCTQDYNEDAIDDFDTSQVLCDVLLPLPPPPAPIKGLENQDTKRDQLDTTDMEMSALNWSASNSKCCALSSTKADDILPRGDACITPDLTAPSVDRNICTPDLFDLIMVRDGRRDGSSSPDPFVRPADNTNTATPQFGGVKQLVVATIETPTATPDTNSPSSQEKNQDMIDTQRFPRHKLLESDEEDNEQNNQDFVATQAFNLGRPQAPEGNEANQDFIATQAFNLAPPQKVDSPKPSTANDAPNQDFIETQAFNLGLPQENIASPENNETSNQDFIATQAFPAKINSSRCQDFVATQPFHVVNQHAVSLQDKENIPLKDSAKLAPEEIPCSEIDAVLNEMISGTVVTSPVNPNEESIPFFEPCVIKDKNHYQKICQIEGVFSNVSNKSRGRTDGTGFGRLKRTAKSESPPGTPSRKGRRISEGSEKPGSNFKERLNNLVDKKSEALNKSVIGEHGIDSIPEEITKEDKSDSEEEADSFKNVVNRLQSRRSRIQSRLGTPGSSLERNEVNADMVDKSNMEPPTKNIRGRKAKKADTKEPDSSKDIPKPTARTRRQTSDEDDRMPGLGKGRKAKNSASSKADTSKNIERAKVSKRVTRQNSADDAELLEEDSSVTERGKKAKKVKSSKEETSKDIPKSKPRTRRQTADEDAMTPKAEKERQVQGEEPKDMPKPAARTRRKASAEETESVTEVVKPKRGGKAKKTETTTAEATVNKPMIKTRRITISEGCSTQTKVKVTGALIKRAVVRISRVSIEQLEASTSAGNNAKVTGSAKSCSATPSNEEPSSSSAAAKGPNVSTATTRATRTTRAATSGSATPTADQLSTTGRRPKRLASGEEPTSSSVVPTKKPKMSADEVLKNRSGATATRFSQPDADPLKALNLYVRKAKTTTGKIKVAFTMCNRPALESVLKSLKHVVEITEDPLQCDLLVMDKGERTYKFLTVIASNKPVLSTNWLHSVKKTRSIDIKADHLFSDPTFEETYKFKPSSVLEHPRLLYGMHFMLGQDIVPKASEMKVIIHSAGGKVHAQPPSLAISVDLYVVTTSKDTKSKRRLNNYERVHFIKTEAVMQALVQHNIEMLQEHTLKL
ncbi:uncharacterized protein LOC6736437 isoform X2 [Drosophila simulans]|uniref:PAX-interacting protein 1 n=1 Tax=Drosophila simulans TaxID=7240 RepID=A0A0J9RMM9_DROSI|nr:uncharacterized protein LOC6736437 isoform X2 [Drosophila simulans]KMY96992.1 uncharacterized protein Dsimw501_GD13423, isoform D [Drosophila simulans]